MYYVVGGLILVCLLTGAFVIGGWFARRAVRSRAGDHWRFPDSSDE